MRDLNNNETLTFYNRFSVNSFDRFTDVDISQIKP